MKVFFSLMAAMAATCAASAWAQTNSVPGGVQGIGLGVIIGTQPYLDIEDETRFNVIPALSYDKGRFWFAGKQAGLILTDPDSEGPWEVSAILDYRFQGYEADESPAFAGMEDRDGTLEAGAVVTYDMGAVRLVGQARADVLDTHSGFDLTGQAEYEWQPAKYTWIRPYAGIAFRSADHANYYYGVTEAEATAVIQVEGGPIARPAYDPGETLNPYLGVFVRQALSRHLVVSVFAQTDFLPTEITDSPIIDAEYQTTVGVIFAKPFVE